jgi:hypothetical protein
MTTTIENKYFDAKTDEVLELCSNWFKDKHHMKWAWFTAKSGAVLSMYECDVIPAETVMFKSMLKFQAANVMDEDDNAICPKCLDHWDFDETYAWYNMSETEREELTEHGYIHVLCEDCEHSEDVEEFWELMNKHNVFVTVSRGED